MEHHKIPKLLKDSTASESVAKKWIEVNDLKTILNGQYSVNKNIRFKTPILRSNLYDYSDAYIATKRRITITRTADDNRRNEKLTFKNNVSFNHAYKKLITHL